MPDEKAPSKNRFLYILNENKEVVAADDIKQWGTWMDEHNAPVVVCLTEFSPLLMVSTIFKGTCNTLLGRSYQPPLVFETKVFGGKFDADTWRWSTWQDAEAGHKKVLDMVNTWLIGAE